MTSFGPGDGEQIKASVQNKTTTIPTPFRLADLIPAQGLLSLWPAQRPSQPLLWISTKCPFISLLWVSRRQRQLQSKTVCKAQRYSGWGRATHPPTRHFSSRWLCGPAPKVPVLGWGWKAPWASVMEQLPDLVVVMESSKLSLYIDSGALAPVTQNLLKRRP